MRKMLIGLFGFVSALSVSAAVADECQQCYAGCFGFCDATYGGNPVAHAACYGGCGYACAHYVCP